LYIFNLQIHTSTVGYSITIVAIVGIAVYCLWRRFVASQKRKQAMRRNLALSHVSRMPILDRAIAERTWRKSSVPALDHPTKEDTTSAAVY